MKKPVFRAFSMLVAVALTVSLIVPLVSATEVVPEPTSTQTEPEEQPTKETESITTEPTVVTQPEESTPPTTSQATAPPAATNPQQTVPTTSETTASNQNSTQATETTAPTTTTPQKEENKIIKYTTTQKSRAAAASYQMNSIGIVWMANGNTAFRYDCPGAPNHQIDVIGFHRVIIDGTPIPAYCLDPAQLSIPSQATGINASAEDSWQYSLPYYITREQQQAIGLALLYGYPNQLVNPQYDLDRRASYEAATQIIIWEIVLGIRSPVSPFTCSNYGLRNAFTGNCAYYDYYASHIREGYDIIEAKLAKHTTIPSFSNRFLFNAPTHTLAANSDGTYSITLTDNNNILSEYTFTNTDTLKFSKNGNKLTITSTEEIISPTTIAPVKYIPALEKASFLVLDGGSDDQTNVAMLSEVTDDPVPTYFKLKTAGGTVAVEKSTSTGEDLGGWAFSLKDGSTTVATGSTDAKGKLTFENIPAGTYKLVETIPSGSRYECTNNNQSVTVTVNTTTTVKVHNQLKAGWVSIKKATNTGKNLSGWQFGIYSDINCTKQLATITTNDKGVATSGELNPGTVYIKEITKKDGWICDTAVKSITVVSNETVTLDYTFTNTQLGTFQIIKKTNTGKDLGYWTFKVYSDAKCTKEVATLTTGTDGKTGPVSVAPGTYYFKEVGDTKGRFNSEYWPDETKAGSFVVSAGTTVYPEWTNNQYGKIKFIKDTNTGKNLDNWEFELYSDAACTKRIGTYKTDANGEATTGVLKPGTYYAKEVARNDPYWVSDTSIKTVTVNAGYTSNVTVKNTHRGQAKITKETNTGNNLSGWEFGIYADQTCTDLKAKITSGENGAASTYLEPGTYWVKEIGMGNYTDEYWTYDAEVKQITLAAGEDTAVTFTNIHNGKILIKKTMDTDGPLEGWKFQITKLAEKEEDYEDIGTFISLEDGTFLTEKLLPGEYKIEELFEENSLYFCKTENPITVTVKEGETVEAPFTNALRPGRIEIEKVNTAGTHLQNAKFLLEWSEDGKTWTPVIYSDKEDVIKGGCSTEGIVDGSLITPESGIIAFENLYPGIQYRVTELEAPAGYVLLEGHVFTGELPVETLEVKLKVVNSHGYELPASGSSGTGLPVALGVGLATMAAILLVLLGITYKPHCVNAMTKIQKKGRKNNE